jgi:predicted transcriptional regulator YheO
VVLHDLRSQKIDYIANNLSKREIGDDAALEDLLNPAPTKPTSAPTRSSTGTGRRSVR